MATNTINGKRYVGATTRSISIRRHEHYADAKNKKRKGCSAFHGAIRKYGHEAFRWEIIYEAKTVEDLMKVEINTIEELKPEYNIAYGGFGFSGARNRPVVCLVDGIRYIGAAAAARKYGIAPARIMQICQKGGSTNTGLYFRYADSEAVQKRVWTEEELEIQRSQVLAALERGQMKIKKRVICIESGRIFGCITDAARELGLNLSSLAFAIQRGGKSGGYTFQLYDETVHTKMSFFDVSDPIARDVPKNSRRVICLNDRLIFDGISAAVRNYGVNRAKLTQLCVENDYSKSIDGRKFSYLDQWCANE